MVKLANDINGRNVTFTADHKYQDTHLYLMYLNA